MQSPVQSSDERYMYNIEKRRKSEKYVVGKGTRKQVSFEEENENTTNDESSGPTSRPRICLAL